MGTFIFTFIQEIKTLIFGYLHDIAPNVKAKERYVYCHNPSPFMKSEIKNLKYIYKVKEKLHL